MTSSDRGEADVADPGDADYGVKQAGEQRFYGEEVRKKYDEEMKDKLEKIPKVCQAAKTEVKTDPYMEDKPGVAEIQISSGEESVDKETDLGNKRNQRYLRHVEDPEAGKEVPPWRMQT